MNFEDKNVAILGLGIEGIALYDFLKDKVSKLTVLEKKSREKLLESAEPDLLPKIEVILGDPAVNKVFGENYLENLQSFDILFRSPSVYLNDERIIRARESGVNVSSQIQLFFDLCPCKIIGVTGTKGKGTTSSLIYKILENNFQLPINNYQSSTNSQIISDQNKPQVFLAGNIGYPVITLIPQLHKYDVVILELSNFQLVDLHSSPDIAVVTNLGVDHLDYHEDKEEYWRAKESILAYQKEDDIAVLNADSTFDLSFLESVKSKKLFFSKSKDNLDAQITDEGTESKLIVNKDKAQISICRLSEIKLLGRHNLENAAAAVLAADVLGIPLETIQSSIKNFEGLPFRLELAGEIDGIKFVNDSFATNPGPTIAAITSFSENKILILGGSPKGADFDELAEVITKSNVTAVLLIGEEAGKIREALVNSGFRGKLLIGFKNLDEVVEKSLAFASSGDIVLFSPACASFDMFKNYKVRGAQFQEAVGRLIHKKYE